MLYPLSGPFNGPAHTQAHIRLNYILLLRPSKTRRFLFLFSCFFYFYVERVGSCLNPRIMPPKKDLCRNFQRGSCQYGQRCKFLHATSQQSKANPFGFGTQTNNPYQRTNQQQQMPNPFGFGVQSNAQSRGSNGVGSKPNQFKPFENKWTRSNPSSGFASRQPDNQPRSDNHECTDSESCKRVIVEDCEKEEPLWKLTCYGHNKKGLCDIVGDISCEELRALAYDDAKNGKNLQFAIERERSLVALKLAEFQSLLQRPYAKPSIAAPVSQNPLGGGSSNFPTMNSSISPPASNFSQLNASLNTSSAAAPSYAFGQSNVIGFQNTNNQVPNAFQMSNSAFNSSGAFGSQPPQQSVQNPFSFGSAQASNGQMNDQSNPFSTFANSSQAGNVFGKTLDTMGTSSASNSVGFSSISTPWVSNMSKENTNVDDGIWAKPEWKWNTGEIPEDPPPDMYIR